MLCNRAVAKRISSMFKRFWTIRFATLKGWFKYILDSRPGDNNQDFR